MNDDRRNGRQQCPARFGDGGCALAFMVGRGRRKRCRSVSPRYQPGNFRRGLNSLFAHRGSGGGAAESIWTAKQSLMRLHSSRASVFLLIGSEGEQSNHRFRTFLLVPTRRSPGTAPSTWHL